MSASQSSHFAVLIADIVESSKIDDLKAHRDQALSTLSKRHLKENLVLSRYTVTAWDEFQNVVEPPWRIPQVIWDLRVAFFPVELRIGIGIGSIDERPRPDTPINRDTSGEAFLLAREAISRLDHLGKRSIQRTTLLSVNPDLNRTVNLALHMMDCVLSTLSEKQRKTIHLYEETGSQEKTAQALQVKNESTISRSLQRSFYLPLREGHQELTIIIQDHLAP